MKSLVLDWKLVKEWVGWIAEADFDFVFRVEAFAFKRGNLFWSCPE